jgi:hypothetical protein
LKLQAAPQVTVDQDTYQVTVGHELFSKCDAKGSPTPKVAWHKLNGTNN